MKHYPNPSGFVNSRGDFHQIARSGPEPHTASHRDFIGVLGVWPDKKSRRRILRWIRRRWVRVAAPRKPNSVYPGPFDGLGADDHFSGIRIAAELERPTREVFVAPGPALLAYLVLLPVGFAVPSPSLETRCALTAPFHPCWGKG